MKKLGRLFMSPKGTAIGDVSKIPSTSTAVALIDEGNALEEQGRINEAMARYDAAVQTDPQCARAHLNRGNVLLASGKIEEARLAYKLAIACNPQYAGAHFNLGNLNSRSGEYELALHNYQVAAEINPEFANAFVAMGNALDNLGRTSEARRNYERALTINPRDAGVHFNLGLLALSEGRHDQAVASLRTAITVRSDYAAAHWQLGRVLSNLGCLDGAETSLRRALSLEPESEEILCDLGVMLLANGKAPEGVQLILPKLAEARTSRIKPIFATCVAHTKFATTDSNIRAATTAAITEAWTAPYQLSWAALSLIMLDPKISRCVHRAGNIKRTSEAPLFDTASLTALAEDQLLHALLVAVPVSSLEFEHFLTAARCALLETASREQPPSAADLSALPFYAALTRQCFINEYIFDCDDRERTAATACRAKLVALLDAEAMIPPLLLLAVAAYFPLHTLPAPDRLLATDNQGVVESVIRQQIREPLQEHALRTRIKRLTSISDGVSEMVRDQYEQNPYPRWVKIPIREATLPFNKELRRILPLAQFSPMPDDLRPEMLIAGCGTGGQSILDSQRFLGIRALAVDLSLSSISYAVRKTQELGITDLEYAQADIMKLGELTRMFDIIASVGVLHHLADPFIGWRILLSRLRPGGFMHLGLYSRLARRHVFKAREYISARGYSSTPDDIRRFRRDLTGQEVTPELQWLSKTQDFYSTSDCRDLLFHVQEHCLTLEQIESFLSESKLRFLGFELDLRVLQLYRTRFTGDPACTNLQNWARFETENPDTFVGMYKFWIQKTD